MGLRYICFFCLRSNLLHCCMKQHVLAPFPRPRSVRHFMRSAVLLRRNTPAPVQMEAIKYELGQQCILICRVFSKISCSVQTFWWQIYFPPPHQLVLYLICIFWSVFLLFTGFSVCHTLFPLLLLGPCEMSTRQRRVWAVVSHRPK